MTPMPDQEPQPRDAASELASFGEELRREREIRGISLKEISDATKISKRFLEALERNDHKTLPAPVFTRGFVREYARYVGLSSEDMVNRYNFAAANDDRIEKPPTVAKYPETPVRDITPKPAPKRGLPPTYALVDRNAIALVLLVAALAAVAYWAVQFKRKEREVAEAASLAPVTSTRPVTLAPPPDPVPTFDDSTLRMTVEVTADSWVELQTDGKIAFKEVMNAGERRSFEAKEQFRFLRIGNASGLNLTINGVRVPRLGTDGEVLRDRVYDRQVLTTLRAASRPQDPS
jgi:cytoskeletal protein RodZ